MGQKQFMLTLCAIMTLFTKNKPPVIDSNFAPDGATWRTPRNMHVISHFDPFAP